MRTSSATLFAFIVLLATPLLGRAQITIDGDLSESEYQKISDEDNADGFQTSEIDELSFHADDADNVLYVGVKGTLNGGRGYGLWINVSGSGAPSGYSAGSELGIDTENDVHYINGQGDGVNQAFTADFEVDYALALGANAGGTEAFAAQYTSDSPSAKSIEFVFSQDGEKASGTGPNGSTIEFAFDNSGGSSTGAELKIPFSELGASASNDIELFSFLATNTGLFSNETIPGDGTQLDDGTEFNAKWDANPGGPYHTDPKGLPVELATFDARKRGGDAVLSWTTASETNNSGFAVQHAASGGSFKRVGWMDGAGTTTKAQFYQSSVEDLSAGTHHFRLKQVDVDGSTHLSKTVTVEFGLDQPVRLTTPAPNPVRQQATLSFAVKKAVPTTLTLYNVLGQRVATLYRGTPAAEESQTVDLSAGDLSSGVYFLRLQAGQRHATQRMTVVR